MSACISQDLAGSRRLLTAILPTTTTSSSSSSMSHGKGYRRPDLRTLMLRSVMQSWVAFAHTSKIRAERALRACLALRARRRKLILKVFGALSPSPLILS